MGRVRHPVGFHRCRPGLRHPALHPVQRPSASGYVSNRATYTAQNCKGCSLRCLCFDASGDRRVIDRNHKLEAYRQKASATGNSSMASGRSIACLLRSWALRCLCRFILKDCAGEAPCRLVSCFCRARLPRLSRTRLRACSSTRLERDPSRCFSGRALLWVRALWSHAAPRRLCGPCVLCKACVQWAFRGLLVRLSRGAYRGFAVARFPTARVLARPRVKHAPRLAAPAWCSSLVAAH